MTLYELAGIADIVAATAVILSLLLVAGEIHKNTAQSMKALFEKHVRFHLGFPGAREWWEQLRIERGFPEAITEAIDRAIE